MCLIGRPKLNFVIKDYISEYLKGMILCLKSHKNTAALISAVLINFRPEDLEHQSKY